MHLHLLLLRSILLSLVRTEAVGHLRDVRRLIVALSRARLGLYVFCRESLFASCAELSPAISKLIAVSRSRAGRGSAHRGGKLQLVAKEGHPTARRVGEAVNDQEKEKGSAVAEVEGVAAMGLLVYEMAQQALAAAAAMQQS